MEALRTIAQSVVAPSCANCAASLPSRCELLSARESTRTLFVQRTGQRLYATASTSRLLLECGRGARSTGLSSSRRRRKSQSARASTFEGTLDLDHRRSGGLSPATFVLTEKVLRLWKTQPRSVQRIRETKAATAPAFTETEADDIEETGTLEAEPGVSSSGGTFNWHTNWYPVIPEIDLDKSVPYPFEILGRKVVIWNDGTKWSCVLDVCPHRLAPLSEGRIDEQGCIQCSYHGWSFRGDGSCANIPQARREGPESRACQQSKAAAVSLPTVVKQGIVFIWPDENSPELASNMEPPITPGIDEEGWCAVGTFRDLHYGYDTGMENLADPSHVPIAHHNVNDLGKRSDATFLDLKVKTLTVAGFEGVMKIPVPTRAPSIQTFQAPARLTYEFKSVKIKNARAKTTTYCVPTSPGNCRILIVQARNFWLGMSSGPNWWQLFPRWLDHQRMLDVLDGDASLLHEQERYLEEKTQGKMENWHHAYFMPTTADRYVGAFRHWLTKFAGKGVQWAEGVDPRLPPLIVKREDLLNRYTSHTKQCQVCSEAVQNFEFSRKMLFVLAAVLLGAGAVLRHPTNRILAVSVAGIAGLIGWSLNGWIQMFYYKGYDHARIP